MPDDRIIQLVKECLRQSESCMYTGANLYTWQKHASWWRAAFLVLPIIAAGFSTFQLFTEALGPTGKIIAAFFGLLAGFFPAIFIALNMDMRVADIGRSAAEFTSLRDRFRQAANIGSRAPFDEFKAAFEVLMDRMDAIRASAPPAPDWCFRDTQKKVDKGDYTFAVDAPPSTHQGAGNE